MGILDFLKRKPEPTAVVAKERLRIIVAQERSTAAHRITCPCCVTNCSRSSRNT
jgi:septum formation topological specificity factor MinE